MKEALPFSLAQGHLCGSVPGKTRQAANRRLPGPAAAELGTHGTQLPTPKWEKSGRQAANGKNSLVEEPLWRATTSLKLTALTHRCGTTASCSTNDSGSVTGVKLTERGQAFGAYQKHQHSAALQLRRQRRPGSRREAD